jgi:hypothetical protein
VKFDSCAIGVQREGAKGGGSEVDHWGVHPSNERIEGAKKEREDSKGGETLFESNGSILIQSGERKKGGEDLHTTH